MPTRNFLPVFGRCIVTLLLLLAALSGVAQVHPVLAAPALVLDATEALPGDQLIAHGTGFTNDEERFTLVLMPTGSRLARGRTDEQGAFQTQFTAPPAAPGDYTVLASVQGQTAEAPLRILASTPPTETPAPPTATTILTEPPTVPSEPPTSAPTITATSPPTAPPTSTPPPPTNTPAPTATAAACVPSTRAFVASADAVVEQASPGVNVGGGYELRAKLSPTAQVEIYLRFDLTGLDGPITRASLQLTAAAHPGAATASAPEVRLSSPEWAEGAVTWATKPTVGALVAAGGGAWPADAARAWDVTAAVGGDGALALALLPTGADGVSAHSREQTRGRPTLTVTFGCPGAGPPPLDTPVPPTPAPLPTATAPPPTATPTRTTASTPSATPTPTATSSPATGGSAVLLAAGDIAGCSSSGDEATANLLDGLDGTVATLGDNVYGSGTASEFSSCYDPNWGRHKARTHPAPGNHEYETAGASGYYGYFGDAATPLEPGCRSDCLGYYSYDLGVWHVIVINSNIDMSAGSAQMQWLVDDLAAHPTTCTLAYWHHPRYSSGSVHGSSTASQPIWQALYDAGAEIVLVGHDHTYERFAPQDATGQSDPQRGIREFVVGTGGRGHYAFGAIQPNSEVRNSDAYGVLKLTLTATGYSWEFVPEAGKSFSDSGSGSCH